MFSKRPISRILMIVCMALWAGTLAADEQTSAPRITAEDYPRAEQWLRTRDSILVLAPNGIRVDRFETIQGPEIGRGRVVEEVLFVRELSEREKLIDGESSGYDEVAAATGVEVVKPLS